MNQTKLILLDDLNAQVTKNIRNGYDELQNHISVFNENGYKVHSITPIQASEQDIDDESVTYTYTKALILVFEKIVDQQFSSVSISDGFKLKVR